MFAIAALIKQLILFMKLANFDINPFLRKKILCLVIVNRTHFYEHWL